MELEKTINELLKYYSEDTLKRIMYGMFSNWDDFSDLNDEDRNWMINDCLKSLLKHLKT